MGFYAPAQIVRDARDHGVTVHPPDVNHADWDCTLEPSEGAGDLALRLGLRQVKGLKQDDAEAIVAERAAGGAFADPQDLWRRCRLNRTALAQLARADAFRSVGLDRRQAAWAVSALGPEPLPLFAKAQVAAAERREPAVDLPEMRIGEHVVEDYASLSLSLKQHPVALLRDTLDGFAPARTLAEMRHGRRTAVAGLVLVRQRPGSAKGVIFITLEDETGVANLVVFPSVFEANRRTILGARLLGAAGRVERQDQVIHLKVERLVDLSARLDLLTADPTEDPFAGFLARADEVRRPTPDQRELQRARNFR